MYRTPWISRAPEMPLPCGPRSFPPRQTNAASVLMANEPTPFPPTNTLCQSQKSTIGNRSSHMLVMNPESFTQSCCLAVRSFQDLAGRDWPSRQSVRAAARIARSLPELFLRVSLLRQFRSTSAPGVDEPVADLFTNVSSSAPRPHNPTNLSHCETGAPAKHLLLFLGGVRMSYVLLKPLFKHIRNVPG